MSIPKAPRRVTIDDLKAHVARGRAVQAAIDRLGAGVPPSPKCKAWCGTTDLNSIPAEDAAAWWHGVAGSYVCSPACARQGESAAVAEGWKRIDTLGTLLVRVTPREPPSVAPTMLELRVLGGEGQEEGTVRLTVGTRVTTALLGMLADLLELADCTEGDEG